MQKFCKSCGNQLELSQRFCSECGTVNPFFVQAFTFISDQSEALEKLRLEKERIEKELLKKEEEQAEFTKQEQLKREKEASEKAKSGKTGDKKSSKELTDSENLKTELLRMKEETQQYKKETMDLVNEVREELLQLEEESKQIKQEVELLNKYHSPERDNDVLIAATEPEKAQSSNEKRILASLLIILLGLGTVLAFYYFTTRGGSNSPSQIPAQVKSEVTAQSAIIPSIQPDTILENEPVTNTTDSTPVKSLSVGAIASSLPVTSPVVTDTVAPSVQKKFTPSKWRIKSDLLGKKLSGCDIVVASLSEIEDVEGITLVEKMQTGNLKYKVSAKITQGEDTYNATPYLYYTPDGAFIKIDGTNCE